MNIQLNDHHPWFILENTVEIDPVIIPPHISDDLRLALDQDVMDLYLRRWSSIRSHHRETTNGLMSSYNFRVPLTGSQLALQAFTRSVHRRQAIGYKINASCGFILRHKLTHRLRYFHPSVNNFSILVNPRTIQSMDQINTLMDEHLNIESLEDMSLRAHPTSEWVSVAMTNVALRVYHTQAPLIGGPGDRDKDNNDGTILNNHSVKLIPRESDNLCLFRCLALSEDPDLTVIGMRDKARALTQKWMAYTGSMKDIDKFDGVSLDEFPSIEQCFGVGLWLYNAEYRHGKVTAKLLRRPATGDDEAILKVRLHLTPDQRHVHLITDLNRYAQSFLCSKCSRPFKQEHRRRQHEATCTRSSTYVYKGGPYYITQNVFKDLSDVGIDVPEDLRFHKYRATFDYEAYMYKEPEDTRKQNNPAGYECRHVPMSCSIASNVPGHEGPVCLVSSGSPQDLVSQMLTVLNDISRAAYSLYRELFEGVLLLIRRTLNVCDEEKESSTPRRRHSKLYKAAKKLEAWMKSLPVVGFNSAKYDLCLIHPYLIRAIKFGNTENAHDDDDDGDDDNHDHDDTITDNPIWVIKRGNAIISLSTPMLHFLDVCNFSAPGTSYSRYLKTYGKDIIQTKSFFPYEYVTSLKVLDQEGFPHYDAFFSTLKGHNTLEEGLGLQAGLENYAALRRTWSQRGMKTLRDLLVYYNNMDVAPFLKALANQLTTFRAMGLDLLKDACTLPGLSLQFGMKDLNGVFYTFGDDMADLYDLIKKNIVGGPSIVFTRFAEAGTTRIHPLRYGEQTAEVCRSVIGLDCNSLYPHSMAQVMPTGPCVVRKSPDFLPIDQRQQGPRYSLKSLEWLEFTAQQTGHFIQHAANGVEVRLGYKGVPVDGYDHETMTAYQFHGCLYHGHECMEETDAKQSSMRAFEEIHLIRRDELRENTALMDDFIRHECHVSLVAMWECEWELSKMTDPGVRAFMKARSDNHTNLSAHSKPYTVLGPEGATEDEIMQAIADGRMYGMALVDIHTPDSLKEKFHDMPPIFKTATVGREDIGDYMKAYCECEDLLKTSSRMLISSYKADNILLATPLLRWYIEHGLVVTKVHLVMEWRGQYCFRDWMNEAANMRRVAERDSSKAMLGESAKLLANSAYGKLCEDKIKFRRVRYCDQAEVIAAMRSPLFCEVKRLSTTLTTSTPLESCMKHPEADPEDLEPFCEVIEDDDEVEPEGSALYEVSETYKRIRFDQPIQIPFFVYQYAKLRMLEFYDLMDRYLDPRKWCPLYTDTDSLYISVAGQNIHELVKTDLVEEFYNDVYANWFPSECCDEHHSDFVQAMTSHRLWVRPRCCEERFQWDKRTPGLFKVEWQGKGMVSLCSKTYYCTGPDEDKLSSKGLQKSRNKLSYDQYKEVLFTSQTSGLCYI